LTPFKNYGYQIIFFMIVYETVSGLQKHLSNLGNKKIGFVPTMGALHNGHLALIKIAKQHCDIVVCSIFVNPTQFNNAKDLEVYPRTIASDSKMLEDEFCDILFAPSVTEIYIPSETEKLESINFGLLTTIMEAAYRPGHFDGVVAVVKRLFEIVKPQIAFFGEKDYQQLCVVKQLVSTYNFDIEIVGCPIIRETDGLAMSSRNMNLSSDERNAAAEIPEILKAAVAKFTTLSAKDIKEWVVKQLANHAILKLEYFELAHNNTLQLLEDEEINAKDARAFIVVFAGKTRLLDNMVC